MNAQANRRKKEVNPSGSYAPQYVAGYGLRKAAYTSFSALQFLKGLRPQKTETSRGIPL